MLSKKWLRTVEATLGFVKTCAVIAGCAGCMKSHGSLCVVHVTHVTSNRYVIMLPVVASTVMVSQVPGSRTLCKACYPHVCHEAIGDFTATAT